MSTVENIDSEYKIRSPIDSIRATGKSRPRRNDPLIAERKVIRFGSDSRAKCFRCRWKGVRVIVAVDEVEVAVVVILCSSRAIELILSGRRMMGLSQTARTLHMKRPNQRL